MFNVRDRYIHTHLHIDNYDHFRIKNNEQSYLYE